MNNLYKIGLYSFLKGKKKTLSLNEMYMNIISCISSMQFKYKTPDFNQYNYESAIQTGLACFYKCNVKNSVNYNKWCCTPAHFASVPDNMGISDKVTTHGTDYALELTVDKDCVLIYNNSAIYPDYIFGRFADCLTECDKSMDALVKWSRMTPIPKVHNDEDIAKYESVMNRILDGNEINVISDNSDLLSDGHKSIDDNMLRLTDETAMEKMHFFSEYHEQLIKRLCTLGGIPFSQSAKSAQSLQDELHDMDVFSTFMISDRHNNRKEGFERAEKFMKEKENIDFSFDFDYSEYQKIMLDRIKAEEKQVINDSKNVSRETIPDDKKEGENDVV